MKVFYEKCETEKEAFVMAKELDKAITEALRFEPESVKELEHKKQLITEWKKKEADLQKFLNNNKIKSDVVKNTVLLSPKK